MLAEMIFQPKSTYDQTPDALGLKANEVWLEPQEGLKVHGWWFAAPNATQAVLFLHGSAGNIGGRLTQAQGWLKRGVSVLLLDWRGFGESQGSITQEADVYADARHALDWITQNTDFTAQQCVVWGESFGAAAAVQLSTQVAVGGVVLESPFNTLPAILSELVEADFPGINEVLFEKFVFNNQKRVGELKSPVMIIHGREDKVCPPDMVEGLFTAAKEPKELWTIASADHDHILKYAGEDYWDKPLAWLATL